MRKLVAALACAALVLGTGSLVRSARPNPGQGVARGHPECNVRCAVCEVLVDLTPNKKYDCEVACQPIPGCVPQA